jgi:hypothetical protein
MSAVMNNDQDLDLVKQRVEFLSKESGVLPKPLDRPVTRFQALIGGLLIVGVIAALHLLT